MKHQLRSSFSTQGRRMAGARALWMANGMKKEQLGKPIIAIVNSFTQFVPGHVHLHEIGQQVKAEIEKLGCFAAEFNTIAIDDGIAMGHDGMLYSLPSRDIIADSVEYMVNAHKADAMVCISNCDKITPGMLMAAMRLNIPTVFVSGGPMEAGEWNGQHLDLIDAMIKSADESVSDADVAQIEQHACPSCGCCSGMFTANSMNCLNEAIGLALPGNGTIVATHANRTQLFKDAAKLIVENAYKYYEDGDDSVLPRSIATRQAFLNAMTLDIAMGGSTNTVLHLLAVAHEAEADFSMDDIDVLSRKTPCLCKVAPNTQKYHIQDVNRAGGIIAIMSELAKGGLVDTNVKRVDGMTLADVIDKYGITSPNVCEEAVKKYKSAAAGKFNLVLGSQDVYYKELDTDRAGGCIRDLEHAYSKDGGLVVGIIIGRSTEYYTSQSYRPTQKLSESGKTGPATVIISGIGLGMLSTAIPVIAVVVGIIASYLFASGFDFNNVGMGLYGIGIAAVGMLSTLGITLATDAYGPIADNAGGNAEMSGLGAEVRKRTDALDSLGNTTAATGKGFAIGSAALTGLALLASYIEEIRIGLTRLGTTDLTLPHGNSVALQDATFFDFMHHYDVTLMNPKVLSGMFLGSMMAFLFCGLTMNAVGRAAGHMVDEVRRQFREIKGILTGETEPDYERCVAISTKGAQREMVVPSLIAILAPIATGLIFGVPGVLGLLIGGLSSGFVLAIFMANAGGAWDNAKKYVEEGNFGGKGSEVHKATVVGDTVGDPFKDTSGPSLNILIKLMSMVAIVMAGLTVAWSFF